MKKLKFSKLKRSGNNSDVMHWVILPMLILLCLFIKTDLQAVVRYVKVGGASSGYYTSWATAGGNLQAVIDSCSAGDEIWVEEGIYQPALNMSFVMKEGVAIYGGFVGTETMRGQSDWEANPTVLQGNGSHVIMNDQNGLTSLASLDGFTIKNGHAHFGGGIYNGYCSPSILDCIIESNTADDGGGMYNFFSTSYIFNCDIKSNLANDDGGGMFDSESAPSISYCIFEDNTASNNGGGMRNGGDSPILYWCYFLRDMAGGVGGAMYNVSTTPVLNSCYFSANLSNGSGGAISNDNAPSSITGCIFDSNKSNNDGGGMSNYNCTPEIRNCVFEGNSSSFDGGGIFNYASSPTVLNCTFEANAAHDAGGGGGMENRNNSNPNIYNTILFGNSSGIINNSSAPVIKNSLIQGFNSSTDGNIPGNIDPLFVNASDPDGPDNYLGTSDDGLALQPCSPCINKGDNSLLGGYIYDVVHQPRVFDGNVDMGAYELQSIPLSVNVHLSENPLPGCPFQPVTFTASYTGGTDPIFTWFVNGVQVQSGANPQYVSSNILNGDNIVVSVFFDECTKEFNDTLIAVMYPPPDVIASPAIQAICTAHPIQTILMNGHISGTIFQWTRDMPQITGISMSGSGNISGTLYNNGNSPVTVSFIIIPSANGCSGKPDTAIVTIYPLPHAAAEAAPNPACEGELIWFNATGGVDYHWNGPGGFTFDGSRFGRHMELTMAGIYHVTVTNSLGCTSTASVTVSVKPTPDPTISFSPNPACTGNSVQLSATGGMSYMWSGPNGFNSTQQNPVISNVKLYQAGTYTVTVTGTNGCTTSISSNLKVNETPVGSAWYDEATSCAGSTLQLHATGGGTYQWTGPAGFSSNLQNPTRTNLNFTFSGIYTVVITGLYGGCTSSYSVNVQVHPLPLVTASTTTPEVCEGDAAYLYASGGSSYDWTGPYGYHNADQNPIIYNIPSYMDGIYTVKASSEYGCSASASVYIDVQTVNALVNATPNPVPYGGTLYLTASGGQTYLWTGPNGFHSNIQNPIIYKFTEVNAGLYACIVSTDAGCQDTKILLVQVKDNNSQGQPNLETRSGEYVQVFPNPAKDIVSLGGNYYGSIDYTIIDSQGNAVQQGKTTSGDPISIGQLNAGSYYLQWTYMQNGVQK